MENKTKEKLKEMVTFKSRYYNYIKEEADIKNNTFRLKIGKDERWEILDRWIKTEKYGIIKIELKNQPNAHFERDVVDVTFFGSHYIITWKPLNIIEETNKEMISKKLHKKLQDDNFDLRKQLVSLKKELLEKLKDKAVIIRAETDDNLFLIEKGKRVNFAEVKVVKWQDIEEVLK